MAAVVFSRARAAMKMRLYGERLDNVGVAESRERDDGGSVDG